MMQSCDKPAPVEVRRDGRRIRLKWRQLRQRAGDAAFARYNLHQGLAAGASLSVDIRALACGSFVCLREAALQIETTGQGSVAEIDAKAAAWLRMKESGEPPLLLEEIAECLARTSSHPDSLVQLNIHGAVTRKAEDRLIGTLAPCARNIVLSSRNWDLVCRIAARLPEASLGYDPVRYAAGEKPDILRLVQDRAAQAQLIFLHRELVRACLKTGNPLVADLHGLGYLVDCWTIDQGLAQAEVCFAAAVESGCDQITTNTAAWLAGL